MYCPECGTESPSGLRFCRACGANLKVIGKAVALGQAIARGDGGPLPKLKELMESAKVKQVTDRVSQALERMSHDVSRASSNPTGSAPWWLHWKDARTPEQRREDHIVQGTVALFGGVALMIFLHYFLAGLVLKIPPATLAKLPFELDPLIRVFWLVGLLPTMAGFGRIIAGLAIRATRPRALKDIGEPNRLTEEESAPRPFTKRFDADEELPGSIVEHTTRTLDHKTPAVRNQ